jgi:hypothetical protein
MLGKMIQVTEGCDFVGELREKMLGKTFEVEKVYWEEKGQICVGVAPTDHEALFNDGLWCIIYPEECEIVEDSE